MGEHCFRGALERLVLLRTITMRAAHTHRAVVDRWNAGGALELLVCDTLPFTVGVEYKINRTTRNYRTQPIVFPPNEGICNGRRC